MKKPIYLRILLLLLLYAGVFGLIVLIQFPKQGTFTQWIGNLAVTGQYRQNNESGPLMGDGAALLTGKASVIFGGMEFCLGPGAEGSVLRFLGENGRAEELLPEALLSSRDTALFRFPGGVELGFTVRTTEYSIELRIYGNFSGDFNAVELPFRPLRKTVIGNSGDGHLSINSDGLDYSFGPASLDTARFVLLLRAESPALTYQAALEKEVPSLEDYILPDAENTQNYTAALEGWVERNFSLWNRTVREQNDEDLVIALAAESLKRNAYSAAVSAVPPGFLNGTRRSYESSVYLGRLDQSALSLESADQAVLSRISRQISEGNFRDFLKEEHIVEYLTIRGGGDLINNGAALVRSVDPGELTLDILPGILEACIDWAKYRPYIENPFERLIDQMEPVVSEALRLVQEETRVFACVDDRVDIEFNLRLGKALLVWAENSGSYLWGALARSLVLSSLLQGEETTRAGFLVSEDNLIIDDPDLPEIAEQGLRTARLCRILSGEYYPRAVPIETAASPIWAWTAASALGSSWEGGSILDIAVVFPAGQTHYMLIRGIPAFDRLQLYGMDYRTDPQFERYDSSGWAYLAGSQILLVKMSHRAATEHIRIYFE